MITTLHIKNIGIIDEITIDLNEGFNVLTGETGAGKTLIVDSLNIISGGRFSKEMIRSGEEFSLVEACMYLPNSSMSEDGNVIVTREVYANGKNLCKINGRLVTVSELREFMKFHVDIHGQFDNQLIMDEANHIKYLDEYLKSDLYDLKEEYLSKYNRYIYLNQKLKENYGDEKQRQRQLDILNYELCEIDKANLKIGEEDEINTKLEIIKNSEKISENLNIAKENIDIKILSSLDETLRHLCKISNIDTKYEEILNNLQNCYYVLEDANSEIADEIEKIDFDEFEANEILKRADVLSNLKRKYGSSIKEILCYRDEIKEKIDKITQADEINSKLSLEIEKLKEDMLRLAIKINKVRNENKIMLEDKINDSLKDLEMNNAKIKIEVILDKQQNFNENGLDKVRFLVLTNKGDDFKSLTKIASGGEISRIVLSIKSCLANINDSQTCIFDEIDTGISGKAAKAVGIKLKKIAKNHQVICVTHLAPVAACADYHYYISKDIINSKTITNVELLKDEDSTKEIARISSGNITEIAVKYALELKKETLCI